MRSRLVVNPTSDRREPSLFEHIRADNRLPQPQALSNRARNKPAQRAESSLQARKAIDPTGASMLSDSTPLSVDINFGEPRKLAGFRSASSFVN